MQPRCRKLLVLLVPSLQLISRKSNDPLSSPPPIGQHSLSSETLLPQQYLSSQVLEALAVLVLAFFLLLFFSIFAQRIADKFSRRWRRRRRPEITGSFSTRSDLPNWSNWRAGVEPGTIQALPVYFYGGGKEKYYEIKNCAICLGEFEENEAVKEIPFCKHEFHPHCIDRWLQSHVTCPVCRSIRLLDDSALSHSEWDIKRSTDGNQGACMEEVIRSASAAASAEMESLSRHGFCLRNASSCSSFGSSEPISMLPRRYSF